MLLPLRRLFGDVMLHLFYLARQRLAVYRWFVRDGGGRKQTFGATSLLVCVHGHEDMWDRVFVDSIASAFPFLRSGVRFTLYELSLYLLPVLCL